MRVQLCVHVQLSDFGLATWAPTNSLFQTHSDVVGTFGYVIRISLDIFLEDWLLELRNLVCCVL